MDMFILNEEVARLEADLTRRSGDAYLEGVVELSWHLRQRDTQRAVRLPEQTNARLIASPPAAPHSQSNCP